MIEIGGVAGTLILLVPFAVLLLTVVVAVLRRSSKRSGAPETARSTAEQLAPPSVSGAGEMLTAFGAMPAPDQRPGAHADEIPRIPLSDRVATAEGNGDSAALPALYLALAQEEIARANVDEGADHLRSAIRWAAKARNPAVEADARLELAELARAAGDLTTACEHWQIARGLFHTLDRKDALAGTEDAMRRHGCPTDWVLTDF